MKRGFLVLLGLVLLTGVGAFDWATEGFRVVTRAGAQQLEVERHPRPLPNVRLIDQNGKAFSLGDYRGKMVLVDFIYTRCPTVCAVLGNDFQRLLAFMHQAAPQQEVDLLSISFDIDNDNQEALKLYGQRYGATAPRWRIAIPTNRRDLAALLATFGVVVVPDGFGGFVHSSTVYIVDARGRLAHIIYPNGTAKHLAQAVAAIMP